VLGIGIGALFSAVASHQPARCPAPGAVPGRKARRPHRAVADDRGGGQAPTRAITEALISGKPPNVGTLNRLAHQASATQTLRIRPDGTLTADVRWHTTSAVAELACRLIAELGRLEPSRLRYCAREACDLLLYDTTRSRTQRWHSESPCGSRERQDRWRKATSADNAITA
jgi:predicted RNA-binding Zn ribbon-like protein